MKQPYVFSSKKPFVTYLLLINQMVIKNSLKLKQSKEYVTWILFLNSLCNEKFQVQLRKIKLGMVLELNKRNPV